MMINDALKHSLYITFEGCLACHKTLLARKNTTGFNCFQCGQIFCSENWFKIGLDIFIYKLGFKVGLFMNIFPQKY